MREAATEIAKCEEGDDVLKAAILIGFRLDDRLEPRVPKAAVSPPASVAAPSGQSQPERPLVRQDSDELLEREIQKLDKKRGTV